MPSPAPCLVKFLKDATARWPKRNRASDGIMPSAEHSKRSPKSDHEHGNAGDLTHDPLSGPDCRVLSREVISDPRVKYVIFEGHIFRTYKPQIGWAKYVGSNPHNAHMHVSIKADARNDLSPWPWSDAKVVSRSTLRRGDTGTAVLDLQRALGFVNSALDGSYGPLTELAVREFQAHHGLVVDGIAGKATNALLFREDE